MATLADNYRPSTFDDVIGQDKAVTAIKRMADRGGLGGRAFWFSGSSGTGKTTLAMLCADQVSDKWNMLELDAGALTAARLREIERETKTYGMGEKNGRAIVVNESHGLRPEAIRELLVILERIPSHVVWIFTTTCQGQQKLEGMDDASPLLSRCYHVELSRRGLAEQFARRAQQIAELEDLGGKPETAYLKAVKESRNNLRAVLMQVESGQFLAD